MKIVLFFGLFCSIFAQNPQFEKFRYIFQKAKKIENVIVSGLEEFGPVHVMIPGVTGVFGTYSCYHKTGWKMSFITTMGGETWLEHLESWIEAGEYMDYHLSFATFSFEEGFGENKMKFGRHSKEIYEYSSNWDEFVDQYGPPRPPAFMFKLSNYVKPIKQMKKDEVKMSKMALSKWGHWEDESECDCSNAKGWKIATRCRLDGSQCESKKAKCRCAQPSWTEWTEFGKCSHSCGGGSQISNRQCTNGSIGEEGCIGDSVKSQRCNDHICLTPVWGQWSSCSCVSNHPPSSDIWDDEAFTKAEKGKSQLKFTSQRTRRNVAATNALDNLVDGNNANNEAEDTQTLDNLADLASGKITRRSVDDEIETEVCENAMDICGSWESSENACSTTCGAGSKLTSDCFTWKTGEKRCFSKEKDCDNAECSQWGAWSGYSDCSEDCKANEQAASPVKGRTRCWQNGETEVCEGSICGENNDESCSQIDSTDCNNFVCGQSAWSDWSEYSECSAPCKENDQVSTPTKKRERCWFNGQSKVCEGSSCGGNNDEKCTQIDTAECNNKFCGKWSQWSEFGECSDLCKLNESAPNPIRRRTRCWMPDGETKVCIGTECGENNDEICEQADDEDCTDIPICFQQEWSQWSEFGECSATCKENAQTPSPTKRRQRCWIRDEDTKVCEGMDCGGSGDESCSEIDLTDCNSDLCYQPQWSQWSEFGECSAACKENAQAASPTKKRERCWMTDKETKVCEGMICGDNGNQNCEQVDSTDCNSDLCYQPQWSQWSEFGQCSATCKESDQAASPSKRRQRCWMRDEETKVCDGMDCGENGSDSCSEIDLTDCNDIVCGQPGWEDWGEYSECSAACKENNQAATPTKTRSRCWFDGQVQVCEGSSCGEGVDEDCSQEETAFCNDQLCEKWGEWSEYGECSATCKASDDAASPTKRRHKCWSVGGQEQCEGSVCGESGSEACKLMDDAVDCNDVVCPQWGEWGEYGDCSATCKENDQADSPTKSRSRCWFDGENSVCRGSSCGEDSDEECTQMETIDCNDQLCEKWGEWSEFGECSASCKVNAGDDAPTKTRFKCWSVGEVENCGDALVCGESGREPCKVEDDAVDCNDVVCDGWGEWSEYGDCSAECKDNAEDASPTKTRTRCWVLGATGEELCQGSSCGVSGIDDCLESESLDCNDEVCPTVWGEWGECACTTDPSADYSAAQSTSDIVFTAKRTRSEEGGDLVESEFCDNAQEICGSWADTDGACSTTCGSGTKEVNTCFTWTTGESHCILSTAECENENLCPHWTNWGLYGICSATCKLDEDASSPTKIRHRCWFNGERNICSGSTCGESGSEVCQQVDEPVVCNEELCPVVVAEWNEWGSWGSCTPNCSEGNKFRRRTCPQGFTCGTGDVIQGQQCSDAPSCDSIDMSCQNKFDNCDGINPVFCAHATAGLTVQTNCRKMCDDYFTGRGEEELSPCSARRRRRESYRRRGWQLAAEDHESKIHILDHMINSDH